MKKKVLVAGGAGFIGSHLCDALLSRGDQVYCLDDFSTGSKENISHLAQVRDFEVIDHDVTLPIKLTVDIIFNLACPASPIQYRLDPVRTTKTSVLGTLNLLELARNCGAILLLASTSEVYGDPDQHPQRESYWGHVNPIGPRACYDEGKRCAETLCSDFARSYGSRVKIARIFNTYGSRMQEADGRVIPSFIGKALVDLPIPVFGDGTQSRSFCYVDDLVSGLLKLADTPDDFFGPVNLGNPEEITIGALARLILHMTGSQGRISHLDLPEDDPRRRCPDIELARQKLNWVPNVPLADGLASTIDYFRRRRGSSLPVIIQRGSEKAGS